MTTTIRTGISETYSVAFPNTKDTSCTKFVAEHQVSSGYACSLMIAWYGDHGGPVNIASEKWVIEGRLPSVALWLFAELIGQRDQWRSGFYRIQEALESALLPNEAEFLRRENASLTTERDHLAATLHAAIRDGREDRVNARILEARDQERVRAAQEMASIKAELAQARSEVEELRRSKKKLREALERAREAA